MIVLRFVERKGKIMAATAGILFLILCVFFGIGVFICGIFLFRMQRKETKAGNKIRGLNVVSILMILVGVVSCILPFALFWISILYEDIQENETYTDTGIVIEKEYGKEVFEYEGVKYEVLPLDEMDDIFVYSPNYEADMTIAFNLSTLQSTSRLLSGMKYTCNAYEVKNDTGETLYFDEEFLYCPKEKLDQVMEFYTDDANYEMTLDWIKQDTGREFSREIQLSEEEWKAIENLSEKDGEEISEKQMTKCEYVSLIKMSKDKVVYGELSLVCLDGTWYWENYMWDEMYEVEDGMYGILLKLPENLNKKLNEVKECQD